MAHTECFPPIVDGAIQGDKAGRNLYMTDRPPNTLETFDQRLLLGCPELYQLLVQNSLGRGNYHNLHLIFGIGYQFGQTLGFFRQPCHMLLILLASCGCLMRIETNNPRVCAFIAHIKARGYSGRIQYHSTLSNQTQDEVCFCARCSRGCRRPASSGPLSFPQAYR
jgi:hypothetical protein